MVRRGWLSAAMMVGLWFSASAFGGAETGSDEFQRDVQPILVHYCYDCHGDGMKKGGLALDEMSTPSALLGHPELWWKALKYERAGIMPPPPKPRPSPAERAVLERWIKYRAFGIDAANPDPGRVTLRRLNRVEYSHTIRDLMGVDFKADEEFPPDDAGYGFDDIGDVLTVSPLLLEKYVQAAETIVAAAVPRVPRVVRERVLAGKDFLSADGRTNADRLSFYQPAVVSHVFKTEQAGDYHLVLNLSISGAFDFDPGRCRVLFKADDQELLKREFAWSDGKKIHFDFDRHWPADAHTFTLALEPLTPLSEKLTFVDLRLLSLDVQGPQDRRYWARTKNYDRFFPREEPPASPAGRRGYAAEVLRRFASRAFRRPVDEPTVKRLTAIADRVSSQRGKRFEDGIAEAMVAVLASPRFVFRLEQPAPGQSPGAYASIDEYSLATRLSYFLWSTQPDDELWCLASAGQLREHLPDQVKRMLADSRSDALVSNFTGQWLELRDLDGIPINERIVLARDARPESDSGPSRAVASAEAAITSAGQTNHADLAKAGLPPNRRRFARPAVELDTPLRTALRRETELCFGEVLHQDRSILELLVADHTYVNERLASLYGLEGVKGAELRRVQLPDTSPRGGLLTQGAILVVTSNPTRTSPVKRGQFILENILGAPAPPPPPDVPQLEDSEKAFKDHDPSLREVLEVHRSKPLCASCHARMDPLGLALENFNALGMWRDNERGRPVDANGQLVSGESFRGARDLKRILAEDHRLDFERCLTEKLLTYALGRGLDYHDVETVDQIVDHLEGEQGRMSALLTGIIQSAPFQKCRKLPPTPVRTAHRPGRMTQVAAFHFSDQPNTTQPARTRPSAGDSLSAATPKD